MLHIDEQIDRASTFVQYKNWIHSTTGHTLIHASSEFSPDIDKWITAYLTPTSLSMQWQEIAQAIWYTSKLINNFLDLELQQSDLTGQLDITEQSDSIESLNSFIEVSVDAPAILAKELISSSEIKSVLEIWEQLESELQTRQQPFIIGVNNNNADRTNPKQSFPHASFCLPSVSFSEVHRKVNYRKTYVMINGLSKKAIQTRPDVGTNAIQELEDFMNGFITKYAPKKKDKLIQKRQHEDENDTTSDCSSSDKEDFVIVENPVVRSKRGAPKKK
ncbi:hypothetical protein F8M41_012114 [Gigaspora margarita]|uniref:Uncharacterized protein n=1 Tax=Gigaspora margarita TaxID=4874 RepID=A0A8H4EPV9_GIGMA|nr:hypothetical protein F8M41_012114 [Gigaspora margarita]